MEVTNAIKRKCNGTLKQCHPVSSIQHVEQQGKSEGFDSCNRPCNLAQIWSKSSIFQPVWPQQFDVWPQKIKGHLSYTTSSFVYHFKSIGELKLKSQSGNAQFGSKSAIFCPVWPWNLMDDLGKQKGTSSILHHAFCIISNPSVNSNSSYSPETPNFGQNGRFFCRVAL